MFMKQYTFTWWQVGIFKLTLLCIGAALGAFWNTFFKSIMTFLLIIAVIAGIYILFVMFAKPKKSIEIARISIKEETEKGIAVQSAKSININKATVEELEKLWGVGTVFAQKITRYREDHGQFKTPEEIKLVEGIDEKKWNQWKYQGWTIEVK